MQNPIEGIAHKYASCVVKSCREGKCSLTLDGISNRAIIGGSNYQKQFGYSSKLCDGIVFCQHNGLVLAAVELKGGKGTKITHAIAQIQSGLTLAEEMLGNATVAGWFPLLLYSGHIHGDDVNRVLRNRAVYFRREPKRVEKKDCGASLRAILDQQ